MNRAWQIRKFLLIQPRAYAVRLKLADGDEQEIPTVQCRSWSKVAETIAAVAPELVECVDENGKLIRAIRPEEELARPDEGPALPEVIAHDPQAALLTHFANLLHRAYEHSTEIAFTKLVQMTEALEVRSEGIERRLERAEGNYRRALQDQVDDAFDRADEIAERAQQEAQQNGPQGIINTFMSAAGMTTDANATNGKAH